MPVVIEYRLRRCQRQTGALGQLRLRLGSQQGQAGEFALRQGAVKGERAGQGDQQDYHHQTHSFLTIISAVGKRDAAAGQDQHAAQPEWRTPLRRDGNGERMGQQRLHQPQ